MSIIYIYQPLYTGIIIGRGRVFGQSVSSIRSEQASSMLAVQSVVGNGFLTANQGEEFYIMVV